MLAKMLLLFKILENSRDALFCPLAAVCRSLEPPPDGSYRCTEENRIGSYCKLRCNTGFRPFGTIATRCLVTAQWSENSAGCERKYKFFNVKLFSKSTVLEKAERDMFVFH